MTSTAWRRIFEKILYNESFKPVLGSTALLRKIDNHVPVEHGRDALTLGTSKLHGGLYQ
jgi:hypothetical protein